MLVSKYQIRDETDQLLMPIQIRLEKQKFRFVKLLLAQQPSLYKQGNIISSIASKLEGFDIGGVSHHELSTLTMIWMAGAALACDDLQEAYKKAYDSLQSKKLSPYLFDEVWKLVEQLCKSPKYTDVQQKAHLISLAASLADDEKKPTVIKIWRQISSRIPFSKFPDLLDATPQTAFEMVEQMRKFHAEMVEYPVSMTQSTHPFYQRLGSEVYQPSDNIMGGLELDGNWPCLLAETFLIQTGQVSHECTTSHSLLMASALFGHDVPAAILFLLDIEVPFNLILGYF